MRKLYLLVIIVFISFLFGCDNNANKIKYKECNDCEKLINYYLDSHQYEIPDINLEHKIKKETLYDFKINRIYYACVYMSIEEYENVNLKFYEFDSTKDIPFNINDSILRAVFYIYDGILLNDLSNNNELNLDTKYINILRYIDNERDYKKIYDIEYVNNVYFFEDSIEKLKNNVFENYIPIAFQKNLNRFYETVKIDSKEYFKHVIATKNSEYNDNRKYEYGALFNELNKILVIPEDNLIVYPNNEWYYEYYGLFEINDLKEIIYKNKE